MICTLLTGEMAGNEKIIPMIKLTFAEDKLPFVFSHKQLPVRLAFAMTINKAQGQTFNHVGLFF